VVFETSCVYNAVCLLLRRRKMSWYWCSVTKQRKMRFIFCSVERILQLSCDPINGILLPILFLTNGK